MKMLITPMTTTKSLRPLLLSSLALLYSKRVVGAEYRISNESEFNNFVNNVNSGTNYSGTTVYLDSDLSLSGVNEPVGNNAKKYFLGTFDGQGHIISDLIMNSSSVYMGLFGYSKGLTIRNVVLDSSCSITNSFSGSKWPYIGGIIGHSYTESMKCSVENSVNMADVTFSGNVPGKSMYLGGIAGYLQTSKSNPTYIKNCANYGSITHTGTSGGSFLGGIVGWFTNSEENCKYIQNCLNYGTITHSGTADKLYIGGIIASSVRVDIENCVSAGKILTNNITYVGSIVGDAGPNLSIDYSFWTSDVDKYPINGDRSPTVDDETAQADVNIDFMNKLNGHASKDSTWSKWLLNANNATVTFIINNNTGFNVNSQIVLFPGPATEGTGYVFSGWYTDSILSSPFTSNEVISETTLYGMLCEASNYTVTLDMNGENVSLLQSLRLVETNCDIYGELPEVNRTGYTFTGWFTASKGGYKIVHGSKVTNLSNHTLYAQWEKIPEREEEEKKEKDSKLIYIVGFVVLVVIIVIIIVVVVLCVISRKKSGNNNDNDDNDEKMTTKKRSRGTELDYFSDRGYSRVIATTLEETESIASSESREGVLNNLYPKNYVRPPMEDALLAAGLTEEQATYICSACEIASQRASDNGKLFVGFTEDDAAAIAMYTYDFGPKEFESNPYRIINKSLIGRNFNSLQKASGLLYLVMTALRKLPRYTGKTLYRGVRGEVSLGRDHYYVENVVTWSALSSTSPSMEATKAFLARGSKSKKVMGTLFIIEGGWGYNIQPYSLFPEEVEILLEPERQFKVTGIIKAEGLSIINLQMLDTPLSIPDVFGGERY